MMEGKKELDDEHCGEPEEKAKELHRHSFDINFGKNTTTYVVDCEKEGTIYESLQNSKNFTKKASDNKDKDLVIRTPDNKGICSHFPCKAIIDLDIKTLNIIYISPGKEKITTTSSTDDHGEVVTFDIKTTGGKNIKTTILKNIGLRSEVDEVMVYGYKGQTVEKALEQDGRFTDMVFKECELEHSLDKSKHEMSRLVDLLNGKCFKITRSDATQEAASSKTAISNISNISQPTPNMSSQATPNMSSQLSTYWRIPDSEDLLQRLRSQLKECQTLTPKAFQNHLSQEFGKNFFLCHEVSAMRRFLELGDSVCQVRIDERAVGSGFLLFGKYILTNAHVVLDEAKKHLMEKITVIFFYEKLADRQESMGVAVVALDYGCDAAGHKKDWALLEVCGDRNTQPKMPQPLLKHFGLVTERGQICIFGHPEGQVKRMDPCFTIPPSEREQKICMHMYVTGHYVFPELMDKDIQTYKSCFYNGSSGSPVFDHNFKVVSMHTGGFTDQKLGNVIEYSHPLSIIAEQIIIEIVRMRKVPVLLAMIACDIPPVVMAGVKKILDQYSSVQYSTFFSSEIIKSAQTIREQDSLKDFFRFLKQRDEPEDMDTR